jgi:hypothetical protein
LPVPADLQPRPDGTDRAGIRSGRQVTEVHTHVQSSSRPAAAARGWRYPAAGSRDARLDFIRGFACVSFVAAHFEAFNWLNFLFWERLGIFSGADLFVLISGLLVGITHREVIDAQPLPTSTERLVRRAGKLYVAYVVLIMLVAAVAATGLFDMTAVTSFIDRWAAITHPLFPPAGTPLADQAIRILLLRSTPHQVQILGFYICAMLIAPLFLWLLARGWSFVALGLSWAAYLWNMTQPVMPTGAQFEHAFPLLTWQLYFINALVVGYHARYEIAPRLAQRPGLRRGIVAAASALAAASFLFAQTTDNPSFPDWSRLDLIEPATFRSWYDAYFAKNNLGILRVVSATAFTIGFYALLTRFWRPIEKGIGWFLLPLGRNSLYVFLVHVAFIAAADQIPGYFDGIPTYDPQEVWFNTAVLLAMLAALWLMVRNRVMFSVIPR